MNIQKILGITSATILIVFIGGGYGYIWFTQPTPEEKAAEDAAWEAQMAEWAARDAEEDAKRGYKLLSPESGELADTLCFKTLLSAGFEPTVFGGKRVEQILSNAGHEQWLVVRTNKAGIRRRCIIEEQGKFVISHNGKE